MNDRLQWKSVNAGELKLVDLFSLLRATEDIMNAQTAFIERLDLLNLPILTATDALEINCLIYRNLTVLMLLKLKKSDKP